MKARVSLGVIAAIVLCWSSAASWAVGETREPGKMAVVSARPGADGMIRVTTTAAYFDFDTKAGKIAVTTRIPQEKPGGEVAVGIPLTGLKVKSVDRDMCTLANASIGVQVDFGSILRLSAKEPFTIAPSKVASFGIRAFGAAQADTQPRRRRRGRPIDYSKKYRRWYVCVQPAREFDWLSLYNDRMVLLLNADEKNYASDRAIRMCRDMFDANILLLWGRIWKKYNKGATFDPSDVKLLKQNIDTGHRLGMKVIAYTQTWPGNNPGGIEFFLKGLAKAKDFGLDGAFFDGPARGGWEKTLTLVRESRKLFRDGVLVMHSYPRNLSIYLDYVHLGEHDKSLDRPIARLSKLAARRHAIGGLIENAPGMNEAVIDKILEHNMILRCGHMFVYCDDGILPGAGFSWDVRFLRLYQDYFMPKHQLKGLAYKYGKKLISKAEFQEQSARLKKRIQEHLKRTKALEASGKVALGIKPVSVEVSSMVDPRYNKWLSNGEMAVDGSTTSGIWLGGKAKLGTFFGSPGGKPEDGVKDWLKIDFGKPVDIGSIMYETTYPGFEKRIWQEGFTISGSLDGKTWTVLVEKQGLKKPQRFTFTPANARVRYVKVHNILSHFKGYPRWRLAYVTEIQVYGKD